MIRRQYSAVKGDLARVAGAAGQSMNDDQIKYYLNVATEELMNEYDLPAFFDRVRFRIDDTRIVLPSNYERIAMMTIDRVPIRMQSAWFEFVGYGLDLLRECDTTDLDRNALWDWQGALDRDDCATFASLANDTQYLLRVYGQVDERQCGVRPTITIFGYDNNNAWIRSATGNSEVCATGNTDTGNSNPPNYTDGIQVEINGDSAPFYIQTDQKISEITAISKPITRGNVYVYAMPLLGAGIHLATYAPRDTTPGFRRYKIPGLAVGRTYTVVARCRKRYFPVVEDTDFLIISNLPALKSMIMSVYYLESGEPEQYAKYKSIAVDLLKKEAQAYIGLQRTKPIVTVSEGPLANGGVYIL